MVLGSTHADFWQPGRQSPTVWDRHIVLAMHAQYNLFPMCCGTPKAFFSKYICFAFNALSWCYDRCFTNGKDRRWFWGQNMLNFGKQGNNHPPCVTDTPYLLCL